MREARTPRLSDVGDVSIEQQMYIQSLGLRPENYTYIGVKSTLDVIQTCFVGICLSMDTGGMATETAMQMAMIPRIEEAILEEMKKEHKDKILLQDRKDDSDLDVFINVDYMDHEYL